MASINPFASYVLEECKLDGKVAKEWTLEESLFTNKTASSSSANQTAEEREAKLKKDSSEMFVIYKYVNDPLLKVKSEKYTGIPEYVQAKDLFPVKNLLQTSPLNV
jgi:hypothetical protein